MTRTKKMALLSVALLVMICATALAFHLNPELDDSQSDTTSIFTLDPDAVTSLSWTYEKETVALSKEDGEWNYTEDSTFPLNDSYVESMLTALSDVGATKTIESVSDLSQYGLDEPVCSITVSTDTEATLTIGSETEMGGERYLSMDDGNVYLVDSSLLDYFAYDLYDIVQKEDPPDMSDVLSFTIETDSGSMQLQHIEDSSLAYSDHYTWFCLQDGSYLTLDTELTADLVESVTYLAWGNCVDYKASADTLAAYGLDSPSATVTVEYTKSVQVDTGETDDDGETIYETEEYTRQFTLELGDYTDTACYARIAGSQMVYLIDASICDSMLYADYESLRPDDILVMDWDTVTSIDIFLNDEVYTIEIETEEVTDEDGSVSEETTYSLDGESVSFQSILNSIDALSSDGSVDAQIDSRYEEIRFLFHRNTDTYSEVELAFYQYDSTSCLAELDGDAYLLVSREDILSLVESINAIVLD